MEASSGETPRAGGGRTEPGVVTIRCRENGPLVVEMPAVCPDGEVQLRVADHLGQAFMLPVGKRAVALCRCGMSARRPFCDGSHRQHVFVAGERADNPARPSPPPEGL